MAADGLRDVFRRLRRLADPGSNGLSDAELLERYSRTTDEAAFELLLWRHGPMVYGVCRRMLRRAEDAEDAFQATFLALVRKAASVRRGASVGAWLYQVAYRVALRARNRAVACDKPVEELEAAPSSDDVDWRDLSPVLDEEVRRLPARYREPVVLCYLEGRTHAEAARELGCPKGTVAIRLLRARKLLRTRLTGRGVTLASGLPVVPFVPPAPAALVSGTLRTAFGGPVPVRVTVLTEGVVRAMSLTRLKAIAALLLVTAGLMAAGTALVSRAEPPPAAPAAEPNQPAPRPTPREDREAVLARVPALRDGQLLVIGMEIAPGEKVPADRRISATVVYLVTWDKTAWRRWQDGDPVVPGQVRLQPVKKEYKRLEVGDPVKAGQTVALVDPTLALGELTIKIAALDAAESEARASRKTKEEAERRIAAIESTMQRLPPLVTKDDLEGARLTASRCREEEAAKKSAVVKAQQELIQANAILNLHEIHAPVSGVIKSIEKERGEAVRNLDTVLVVGAARGDRRVPADSDKEKTQAVRAARDGVLFLLGTEINDGEAAAPEQVIKVGSGAAAKNYRRLRVGDTVEAGQLLTRLDDQLARNDATLKEARLQASKAELRATTVTKAEADRRVKAMESSMQKVPGSVSKDDYEGARLTAARYREEEVARRAAVTVCEAELEQAKTMLTTYQIRSPVRGVVRELCKVPGEAVRAGEPIVRLAVSQGP